MRIAARPFGPFGLAMSPLWLGIGSIFLYFAAFFAALVAFAVFKGNPAVAGVVALLVAVIGLGAFYCHAKGKAALRAFIAAKVGVAPGVIPWIASIILAGLVTLLALFLLLKSIARHDAVIAVFAAALIASSVLWLYESFKAIRAILRAARRNAAAMVPSSRRRSPIDA